MFVLIYVIKVVFLKYLKNHKPQKVINMAAQAGVRYSLKNPMSYINSNIVGFYEYS
jgi:UDP-glucose 4-epimerase